MQRLILPSNNAKLTASFKNAAYAAPIASGGFGFPHYGSDFVSTKGAADRKIWASGNGTVVAAGWDYNAGYTVIIVYPQAYNHKTKKYRDVVFRYFHLNSIKANIKKGVKVTKDTLLGEYGGSGNGQMNRWVKHLHLEVDTDTAYPNYSGTFKSSTAIIKGTSSGASSATMVDPIHYLHRKTSAPDSQTYTTTGDRYINASDYGIPAVPTKINIGLT